MTITKEEISLCKQIAEKHRKKINIGDRIIDGLVNGILLVYRKVQKGFYLECIDEKECLCTRTRQTIDFPLWTISDCLKFLKERKRIDGEIRLAYIDHYDRYYLHIFEENTPSTSIVASVESGKTPLEACLKTVLAVLEEVGK